MFLGVSGNVHLVKPTSEQRHQIGALVQAEREAQHVTAKRAYTKAKMNSTTWDRVENGQSVKDYSLRRAVQLLWPETRGDWTQIPGLATGDSPRARYVAEVLASSLSEETKRYILDQMPPEDSPSPAETG